MNSPFNYLLIKAVLTIHPTGFVNAHYRVTHPLILRIMMLFPGGLCTGAMKVLAAGRKISTQRRVFTLRIAVQFTGLLWAMSLWLMRWGYERSTQPRIYAVRHYTTF